MTNTKNKPDLDLNGIYNTVDLLPARFGEILKQFPEPGTVVVSFLRTVFDSEEKVNIGRVVEKIKLHLDFMKVSNPAMWANVVYEIMFGLHGLWNEDGEDFRPLEFVFPETVFSGEIFKKDLHIRSLLVLLCKEEVDELNWNSNGKSYFQNFNQIVSTEIKPLAHELKKGVKIDPERVSYVSEIMNIYKLGRTVMSDVEIVVIFDLNDKVSLDVVMSLLMLYEINPPYFLEVFLDDWVHDLLQCRSILSANQNPVYYNSDWFKKIHPEIKELNFQLS